MIVEHEDLRLNSKCSAGKVRTTAIVLNYNSAADTRRCLDSLSASYTPVHAIVVDNASPQRDIEDVMRALSNVTFLPQVTNVGFGCGCNVGISWGLHHTDSEYFLLINPDAAVSKHAIGLLEHCLKEHPDAGAATPKIVLMENPNFLWYGGGEVYWPKGSARVPGYGGDPNSGLANQPREVGFASGCAIMFRRSAIATLKGFDPRYFMYEEDVELSLRLQQRGHTIRYVPTALVYHRAQGSQRGEEGPWYDMLDPRNPRLAFYVYHLTRNRLLTMASHARGWNAFRFWTIFPIYWATKCFNFAVRGRADAAFAALRGVRDFLAAVRA